MSLKTLKVGLIGLGAISERHFAAFSACSQVRITALCTRSETNLAKRCAAWNIDAGYTDYRKMIEEADIDAVVVSLPPVLHKEVCMLAMQAKKHVFCEKPPAMTAEEAYEMMQCAKENGVLLMYGFMFRFSKKHNVGRDIIESGMLGDILLIREETVRRNACAEGWFKQKSLAGGGPMVDIGSHCLDLARYMMGNNVYPVQAYARTFAPCENLQNLKDYKHGWLTHISDAAPKCVYDVEEMAAAMIRYSNGAELLLLLSNASHIQKDKKVIEFIGTKGGLSVDPELEVHTVVDQRLYNMQPIVDCAAFDYQGSINAECTHFADCILNGTPCRADAHDGWVLMKLIDALYASAESGQAVAITYEAEREQQ